MIEAGKMGVPIVKQLVEMSAVRPEDKITMQAIAATFDAKLLEFGIDDEDLQYWLRACCLASYELGRLDLFETAQNHHPKSS